MIMFKNAWYVTRDLNLPSFGYVVISTTELRNLLLDDDCEYTSDEARYIDEQIFYFVEEDEIKMTSKSLSKLIRNQLK
jgi:hypothetical protein